MRTILNNAIFLFAAALFSCTGHKSHSVPTSAPDAAQATAEVTAANDPSSETDGAAATSKTDADSSSATAASDEALKADVVSLRPASVSQEVNQANNGAAKQSTAEQMLADGRQCVGGVCYAPPTSQGRWVSVPVYGRFGRYQGQQWRYQLPHKATHAPSYGGCATCGVR